MNDPLAQNSFQTPVPNAPLIQRQENPLGAASVAIAGIGLIICLFGAILGSIQQQNRIANSNRIAHTKYQGGDPSILVDKFGVGASYVSQLAIYGVSALIGGTFSLVGFALGVASVPGQQNRIGLIGIVVSPLGPLLLLVCVFLL